MATCRELTFSNAAETRANSALAMGEVAGVLDEEVPLRGAPAGTELVGVPAVVDAQPTRALAPQTSSNEPSLRAVMISTVPGG
jgi:hypothetical protein